MSRAVRVPEEVSRVAMPYAGPNSLPREPALKCREVGVQEDLIEARKDIGRRRGLVQTMVDEA
jgi:hypothetical protein